MSSSWARATTLIESPVGVHDFHRISPYFAHVALACPCPERVLDQLRNQLSRIPAFKQPQPRSRNVLEFCLNHLLRLLIRDLQFPLLHSSQEEFDCFIRLGHVVEGNKTPDGEAHGYDLEIVFEGKG